MQPVTNLVPSHGFSHFEAIKRALRRCGQFLAVENGRSLHSQLIKSGLRGAVFIANNLMCMYADFGFYHDARRVFDEMPERNVVSWTTAISAHTHAGSPSEALGVFSDMMESNLEHPNCFTFSAALKACTMLENIEMGKWIHERVLAARLQFDTVLMNAVVDMYIKCGSLVEARRVFDGIYAANSASWNTMIGGYCRGGDVIEAEYLFSQVPEPDAVAFNTMIAGFAQIESPKALQYVRMMHQKGVGFDRFTFPCALKTCGSLKFEELGTQIHSCVIKCGFEFDHFAGPSLVDMYAKCGRMEEASKVFDGNSESKRLIGEGLPLMNAMVSGYAVNRYDRPALDLLSEIHSTGIGLDSYTLSTALKVCTNIQNMRIGLQVHSLVITSGYHLDYIVGSALVDLYAKCKNLEDGLRLFIRLPHKDVIAWAGLITGCVQQGSSQLAFSLFREMTSSNVQVDHFAVSSVLKACTVLAWLDGGKQIHAFSVKAGFELESVVVSSLIDVYSKCGEIEDGHRVFKTALEKDIVCWTGMIVGFGNNGRAMEAIVLFQEMLKSGNRPNEITFLGILSACRHAGLVREACMFFEAMSDEHGFIPSLEHYCCMVDILSRAGLFEEVKQLISYMPYEADETIQNSLLGGCLVHENADIAKLASIDRLQDSNLGTSGCVTMSNVYAGLGVWDLSGKFREISRKLGAKEAGKTWISLYRQ